MAENEQQQQQRLLNVPNLFTTARLVLAIVTFVLISQQLFLPALICFVVAAGTDWIDGYWARRFNQVSQVGRIYDPFVDKVIICGAFIFLVAEPESGIRAWMAVVVAGREMLVTGLRSFIESRGGDFSANMAGKLKMVFQCVAVGASLTLLWQTPSASPPWLHYTVLISVWIAVISTVYSGAGYLFAAAKHFR